MVLSLANVPVTVMAARTQNDFYLEASLSLVLTKKSFPGRISWNDKKSKRMVPTEFIILTVC